MSEFTVGLIYDSTLTSVVLIEKQRPDWQRGKLNGVGGRIEAGETPMDCMIREAKEETGLDTSKDGWQQYVEMVFGDATIYFFAYRHSGLQSAVDTTTDEMVDWYPVLNLPENVIQNITWLVPLGIEKLQTKSP